MANAQKTDAAADTAAIGPSPARERIVGFNGRQIKVTPLRMRQLPGFAAAVKPLLADLGEALKSGRMSRDTVLTLIEEHTAQLVCLVSAATDVEAHELSEAQADEFLEIATAVLRVNLDFFVRSLLPTVARALPELDAALMNGSGQTPSKP